MNQERCCVFLDLLGFREITRRDPLGAARLLDDYSTILVDKKLDEQRPPSPGADERLVKAWKDNTFSSADHFLSFSDSVFVSSADPATLIVQVSSFLVDCFRYNFHTFNLRLTVQPGKTHLEKHYPVVFRGGVACGTLAAGRMPCIEFKEFAPRLVLTGQAAIDAVSAEKSGKGPRLFLHKSAVGTLTPILKQMIRVQGDLAEVLWPMAAFVEGNDPRREILNGYEMFDHAVLLWKTFNHEDFGIHYFELLKLIVRSFVAFGEKTGSQTVAKEHLDQAIKTHGLGDKREALFSE